MEIILFILVALIIIATTAIWLVIGYTLYSSVKEDYSNKKLVYLIVSSSFLIIYLAGSIIGFLSLIKFNTNWLGAM